MIYKNDSIWFVTFKLHYISVTIVAHLAIRLCKQTQFIIAVQYMLSTIFDNFDQESFHKAYWIAVHEYDIFKQLSTSLKRPYNNMPRSSPCHVIFPIYCCFIGNTCKWCYFIMLLHISIPLMIRIRSGQVGEHALQ